MTSTGLDRDAADVPLGDLDLTDRARWTDGVPYGALARLRRETPVLRHPPGATADGEPFWVLTRHADILAAAADPVFSAQGGGGRTGGGTHLDDMAVGVHAGVLMGMMDDPRHQQLKDLLAPAVTGAATGRLASFRASAAELVDAAVSRGGGNFAVDVAGRYSARTIGAVLGVPAHDWRRLGDWAEAVVGLTNRRTGVVDAASTATAQAIIQYCQGLLAAKAADPDDDLGSVTAAGDIVGAAPLTPLERMSNLVLLVLTGNEQPRNTGAAGVLALAQHPEQWRALRADRSLLPGAIEEMLRWAPPNPYNRRTATRDVDFRGQHIRAGDKVTFWWAAANRDEAVFPEPDTFDIRRDPNPHLSFGAGRHSCVAGELGRVELTVLVETLLDRVAEIRLTGPVAWAPSNKHAVLLDLPVELVPAPPRGG